MKLNKLILLIGDKTMLFRCLSLMAIISTMSVVLSCSGTTSAQKETLLDRNWGRSLEGIRYMQMVDPEANKNVDQVLGSDGNASVNNVDKYQNSFKETDQKETTTILKLQ
jgi:hypothetical protein